MSNRQSGQSDILTGVVLGGIIVGLSSLYLSSKNGSKVAEDITQKVESYKNRFEDFVQDCTDIEKEVENKTAEWGDKVRGTIQYVKDEVDEFAKKEHRELYVGLLIGSVVGGILGVGSAKLLSGNTSGRSLRDTLAKVGSGAASLQRVIQDISRVVDDRKVHAQPTHEPIDEVIDFALTGLQLWRKLNNSTN